MTHRGAPRLGDVIDDFCSRCRLLMNHGVVGLVGGEIKKVRCLTCHFEHPFRRGRAGKTQERKKREMKKLFAQVLRDRPSSAGPAEIQHKPPVTGRKVRIARPEEPEDHHHRRRVVDPPAATLPPPPKGKGRVASWRRAWEDRIKK
jgi:hypothetical protein